MYTAGRGGCMPASRLCPSLTETRRPEYIPAMLAYGRGASGIYVDVYVYSRQGRLHAGIPFTALTHRDSETRDSSKSRYAET